MASNEKRPYHHGDLRQTLINTALDMLQEDSSWQFTLREVARRAGVSHAAPYRHFPDKAALLTELALLGFDQLAQNIKTAITRTSSIKQQFLNATTAYIAFGQTNSALYRLMYSAEIAYEPVHLNERALEGLKILLDLLERGQQDGIFANNPLHGQAAACWAQAHGLTMLSIEGLLIEEKVGKNPLQTALETLFTGLQAPL